MEKYYVPFYVSLPFTFPAIFLNNLSGPRWSQPTRRPDTNWSHSGDLPSLRRYAGPEQNGGVHTIYLWNTRIDG